MTDLVSKSDEIEKVDEEMETELTCLTNFFDDSASINGMIMSPTLSNSADSVVDHDISVATAIGGSGGGGGGPAKRGRWANRGDHVPRVEQIILENGKKLYPSRAEKQKLADDFGISADEVTRIYSNLRRRQPENKLKAKARKRARVTANSPVQIMALSGGLQPVVNEFPSISPRPMELNHTAQPDQQTEYEKSISAQIRGDSHEPLLGSSTTPNRLDSFEGAATKTENNPNMVALNDVQFNPQYAHLTSGATPQNPLLINSLAEMLSSNHEAAKMLLFQPQNVNLLISVLQQQMQTSGTVNLSAALAQINTLLMHNTLLGTPVGQVVLQQLQNQVKQRLGGSSISASPNSDSGISEQPEMSPRSPPPNTTKFHDASTIPYLNQQQQQQQPPQAQQPTPEMIVEPRVASPLFKDPHQIADPEMTKLLDGGPSAGTVEAAPAGIFDGLTHEEREAAEALGQLSVRPVFIFKGSRY